MSKIACKVCREIIAEVDFTKLSLPLTAEQFKTPSPEREVPDPFLNNDHVPSWRCPYCNSYPIFGYEAGPDTLPYVLSEFKNGKFIDVKVDDIIKEQGIREKNAETMAVFQKTLISGLKNHKPIYKKKPEKHRCKTCGATFNHASSLSRHKKTKGHK